MNFRMEQAYKVMKILDDVLANRPNERDSLLLATLSAFMALATQEQEASKDSTADVVEVTRCKDCKYFAKLGNESYNCKTCLAHVGDTFGISDNFYCRLGTRKGDGRDDGRNDS